MKKISSKAISGVAMAVILVLAATQVSASGQNGEGSSVSSHANERTIVGVWRTVVTVRNCQTGEPVVFSSEVYSLFNEGGTMAEYGIGPGSSPALRSPGHGLWRREHGWQKLLVRFHVLPL